MVEFIYFQIYTNLFLARNENSFFFAQREWRIILYEAHNESPENLKQIKHVINRQNSDSSETNATNNNNRNNFDEHKEVVSVQIVQWDLENISRFLR